MTRALVNKIIPFSSVDGPGNRTAIFLQGCNIDCKYCHNPETRQARLEACPGVRSMTSAQVLLEVKKQQPFIRGITVSGGECMLHPDFLTELGRGAGDLGLTLLIDSNGTIDFTLYPDLLEVCQGVLLDIKAYDSQDHINITGTGNATVLKNALFLAENHKLAEVRCVVVPDLYDAKKSIRGIADLLQAWPDLNFRLSAFRPMGVRPEYAGLRVPARPYMERLADILRERGFHNIVVV